MLDFGYWNKSALSALLILCAGPTTLAQTATLGQIAGRMGAHTCISGKAEFEVTLPSSPDPVTYNIALEQGPGDALAPASYLIDWTLLERETGNRGFSAYFDGNHYRYRDLRLQEYHYAADSVPFSIGEGVQNQAQFTDLLPAYMARTLAQMEADSTYTYRIEERNGDIAVSGVRRIKGFDAFDFEYVFDAATGLPRKTDFLYNPASISEQEVIVRFSWPDSSAAVCPTLTEEALIGRYPEVFEKFRTSNFRVESLLGHQLPEFSAPTLTGERYTHHHGERFRVPVVIAFIDPKVESARSTVSGLREASENAVRDFDIIYAFATQDLDAIEDIFPAGPQRPNEHILVGARSMVRDCGVTAYPTLLIAAGSGEVRKILPSYDDNLPTVIVQQTTVMD